MNTVYLKEVHMKKIISLLVVLALVLGFAPISAKAAEVNYYDDCEQFAITVDGRTSYFDFDIRTKGEAFARLDFKYSLTSGKTYYIYDGNSATKLGSFVASSGQKNTDVRVDYGKTYRFFVIPYNYTTKEDIVNYVIGGYDTPMPMTVKTVEEVANSLCDTVSNFTAKSYFINRFDVSYTCNTRQAIYVDGKYMGTHKAGGYSTIKYYVDSAGGKTKFKPGTKHTIKIWPYASIGGANFMGKAITRQVTIANFTAPGKPSVVKLNKNMVSVSFNVPTSQQLKGLSTFYIYAGKKKVKTVKNTGKSSYLVTVKKKGIGKKKIKIVSVCTSTKKKASSKAAKGKKNFCKWNYSKNVHSYTGVQGYARPTKLYYSGKKLMLKGFYVNGHIFKLKKFKIKFKIFVNGKLVAKKTLTKKNMSANSIKNFKVTMKKGKYYDLRHNSVSWDYDVFADTI